MKESDNQFDLQVKALMDDACEDAPVRVWTALNARLHRRKSLLIWFRRAGIAVSAAAILALGLILSGTFRNTADTVSKGTDSLLAEVTSPEIPEEEPLAVPSREVAAPVQKPADKLPVAAPVQKPADELPLEAEEPEQFTEESVPSPDITRHDEPSGDKHYTFQDPFSSTMEIDRGESGRKVLLDVKGLLGNNDNIKPAFNHAAAPSDKAEGTFVQEYGDSQYEIPVSFGLGIRVYLSDKISLGTGIDYTLYGRTFSGRVDMIPDNHIRHSLQYIGIPVNVFYDFIQNDKIQIYGFAGGGVQKAVSNKYRIGKGSDAETRSLKVNGVQLSANIGAGIQYQIVNGIGLYLDPSATYYFDCKQPHSIITEKPLQFNFEVGFRFDL